MGSIVEETVELKDYDVDTAIFVAVGNNVSDYKTTLFWAVNSFKGKKICLLHVHQPSHSVLLIDREMEKEKMLDVLNQYCLILDQLGVEVDKVWIEMDNIEKGIVEVVDQLNIRWLVMGAAADQYYAKKLEGLKSKKAQFVCEHAPISCHIWFVCRGCLIFTRESGEDRSEAELSLPLLLLNSDSGIDQPERLGSCIHRILDASEDDGESDEFLRRFSYHCTIHDNHIRDTGLSTPKFISYQTNGEIEIDGQAIELTCHKLKQAILDAKDSKQKTLDEAVKRWKEEDAAMEAKCKAEALENLCIKEISLQKEMEAELEREKQELEKTKDQCDAFVKELKQVEGQKSILEIELAETNSTIKELEEKIISAVELLISFRTQRDAAKTEYENARQEFNKQRKLSNMGIVNYCGSDILEFSFAEVNEATQDFNPTWKLGEGRYGSVYKGILRHVHVAIKMLPSYGSQSLLDFQLGVEVLSRVRHPHLVTLIGTCSESRSLVYELMRNGSLEDFLACKNKRFSLPWHTRIRIASEICSALIFLHSNKPCIIHGNLKPSKVLLDANSVSKLGDFGMALLLPLGEKTGNNSHMSEKSNLDFTSVYTDPEYIETGILTPESDVYSFGIILLQLLTGRQVSGLVKDVKCALMRDSFKTLLDSSAGDWPDEHAGLLAKLAFRCCEFNRSNRPDLVSDIWSVLEPMKTAHLNSPSCLASKESLRVPSHFLCPIFQEVMNDPQIAADGFTYDADAIRGWLQNGHDTSPMTNLKLEHCNLLPNHALHQAIQEWQQRL